MNNILILGASSFVAQGIDKFLTLHNHYSVTKFRRGTEHIEENVVFGDVYHLSNNPYLDKNYDVIINFIVIKNGNLQQNINYIKSIVEFCKTHHVKKLIHISSIMVYNYDLKKVDENTSIETIEETYKKGYGEIKIAVDQFLLKLKNKLPFEIVFVRPGYVLADNRPCPFIKKLLLNLYIIKGNKKSKQPIVRREDIHKALMQIIEKEQNLPVYHFFPNDGMTKYQYAKQTTRGIILTLPKCIFKSIPFFLMKIKLMPKSLYSRFEGMYIESEFSSKLTEEYLTIKFE